MKIKINKTFHTLSIVFTSNKNKYKLYVGLSEGGNKFQIYQLSSGINGDATLLAVKKLCNKISMTSGETFGEYFDRLKLTVERAFDLIK